MEIYVGINAEKIIGRLESHDYRMAQAIARWQEVIGPVVQREVQKFASIKSGALRRSIFAETRGGIVKVGSRSPYARFVNNGTKPHMIYPRPWAKFRPVLAFSIGGKTLFSARVKHPGTKPTRFLQRALEAKKDFVIALLRQYTLQESRYLD